MNDLVVGGGMVNGLSRHRNQANILKQVKSKRHFDLTLKPNLKGLTCFLHLPIIHTYTYCKFSGSAS